MSSEPKLVNNQFKPPAKINWLQLIAFPIAGLILYWLLKDQDWALLYQALKKTKLSLFLLGGAVYTLGFFFTDSWFNHFLWNRIILKISFKEVLKIRAVSIFLMTLFPPLAVITTLGYMVKKKQIKILPMLSANAVLIYSDLWVIIPQLAFALIVLPSLSQWFWVIFFLFCLGLVLGSWFFLFKRGNKYFPRLYQHPIVYGLRILPKPMLPSLIALRALWPVFQVLGHWLALKAVGINPPLPLVILTVVFMTMTTFMPVAVAGFGAPNAVALLFLPYAQNDETIINAYSLLFQACFLVGRLGIGLVFLPSFLKGLLRTDHQIEPALSADSQIYQNFNSEPSDSRKE